MSLQTAFTAGYLHWCALSFVAPAAWEQSKRGRISDAKMWPWVLLFSALALGQLAIAVFHPVPITEVFATT